MRRCRRCAVLLIGLAACVGREDGKPRAQESVPAVAEDPVEPAALPDAKEIYYEGYLADVLGGDQRKATERYNQTLVAGADEPTLAAEAALRLAGWAEGNRQRLLAMDLAVRASVLGADVPRIKEEADKLRRRIATTVRAQDVEVRGPAAGTVLAGVSPAVAQQFADAEVLLSAYHRRVLQPRLEALGASLRGKRTSMERAVRAYREVAESGVPEAQVAAEFRIASLYYDFSLSLTFELPGELDPDVASSMRNSLRSEVSQLRAKAQSGYSRSLAVASGAGPTVEQWSEAAAIGLASVDDLLRGGN